MSPMYLICDDVTSMAKSHRCSELVKLLWCSQIYIYRLWMKNIIADKFQSVSVCSKL